MNYWLAKTNVEDNTVSDFEGIDCCSIVDSVVVNILSLDLGIKVEYEDEISFFRVARRS